MVLAHWSIRSGRPDVELPEPPPVLSPTPSRARLEAWKPARSTTAGPIVGRCCFMSVSWLEAGRLAGRADSTQHHHVRMQPSLWSRYGTTCIHARPTAIDVQAVATRPMICDRRGCGSVRRVLGHARRVLHLPTLRSPATESRPVRGSKSQTGDLELLCCLFAVLRCRARLDERCDRL